MMLRKLSLLILEIKNEFYYQKKFINLKPKYQNFI